jgi:hypothetical protein
MHLHIRRQSGGRGRPWKPSPGQLRESASGVCASMDIVAKPAFYLSCHPQATTGILPSSGSCFTMVTGGTSTPFKPWQSMRETVSMASHRTLTMTEIAKAPCDYFVFGSPGLISVITGSMLGGLWGWMPRGICTARLSTAERTIWARSGSSRHSETLKIGQRPAS